MKYFLYILLSFMSLNAEAQSKQERIVLSNAELLESTVFGTKDSATLEKLFAKELHYEHSNGKIETRAEALHGITHNQSVYTTKPLTIPTPYRLQKEGDSMIVTHLFSAIENKSDGTAVELDFTIKTTWVKEDGSWKLTFRKADKNIKH